MRRLLIISALAAISVFKGTNAQSVDDYLATGPAPEWVKQIERPAGKFELGQDQETGYLLVDKQVRYTSTNREIYRHTATELRTPNSVENNAAISVDFDPEYERVVFHTIQLIRNGEEIDALDPARFDMYRVETDRDLLIYNGELQVSHVIPDVRPGDILDYSYSISGKNPAIGPNFAAGFQHRFAVPVQRLHNRLVVSEEVAVHSKSHAGASPPELHENTRERVYSWDSRDVPALIPDDDLPPAFYAFPQTIFSSYDSWKSVGEYFAPFYDISQMRSSQIREIAAGIRARQSDPAAQLRAALDFVQREIRYLGIELGQGGYSPRAPDEVLENRFGDCKDMTLLLLAILGELDIQAAPLLVSSQTRASVDDSVPSHAAFDHVIAVATLGQQEYFLDPTRGVQLGDLDHLQQGQFGKGLVVANDSPGIINARAPEPDFWKDTIDTFEVVTDPGAIFLTSVSKYRMGEADAILAWYRRVGAAAADKSFLDYFQGLFPQVEQVEGLVLSIDNTIGEVSLTGKYRILNAWEKGEDPNRKYFYVYAQDALYDMPDFVGANRTMPFRLGHPVRTRHTLHFALDNTWNIANEDYVFDRPSFHFRSNIRFEDDILTKTVTYRTKSPEITPENFRASMSAIKEAARLAGIELYMGSESNYAVDELETLSIRDQDPAELAAVASLIATLLVLIAALMLNNRDAAWLGDQTFHPVSVRKYVILNIFSLGTYSIFWAYKNWRWVKKVDGNAVSPAWRAIFMVFTNFGLFRRMAEKPDGLPWFQKVSAPLAALFLLAVLGEIILSLQGASEALCYVIGTATSLTLVPAVSQVVRLNAGREDCIRRNSRFGWPALGMLVAFLPATTLLVFGLWSGGEFPN